MEIANGFHELNDSNEQRERFMQDLQKRAAKNLPVVTLDEKFLAALNHGLPDCAGVAIGVDRLVMHCVKASSLAEVVSFPVGRV